MEQLQAGYPVMFKKWKIPFFPRAGDDFLPELPHEIIGDTSVELDQHEMLIGSTLDEVSSH